MLGRSSQPRETVVVQQPTARASDSTDAPGYRRVSSDNATPDTGTAASDTQAAAIDSSPATTAKQPKKENKHGFLGAILAFFVVFFGGLLVIKLFAWGRRTWAERKARYASRTNYRL
ncbi:hypothetical protein WJ63_09040 [Burkholderia pyrrocinia]|nr:hypothetical protein WJ63_09040 [Burkholderia pyrrocinia]